MTRAIALAMIFASLGCATTSTRHSGEPRVIPFTIQQPELCQHKVPAETCAKCHPELVERFKQQGDWCEGHDVPESQCLECHPDMKFAVLPALPENADFKVLSTMGEDVPDLAAHAVPGKVTVFDFFAPWCVACRDVDVHLYTLLAAGRNIAVRKLNVMTWETPLAVRYVSKVAALPYVIVYGANGKQITSISGAHPEELEDAIREGSP